MKKGKISITSHARQRLSERLPEINSSNYNSFVSAARYNGKSVGQLMWINPQVADYIKSHFKDNNSTKLKFYRDCLFVFSGDSHKARTLVTVVNLSDILEEFETEKYSYVA